MPVCAASLSRIWLILSLLTKTFTCSHHGQLTPAQESEIIPSVPHHSLLLLQGCLAQVCPHSPQRGSPETPRVCPVPESLPLTPSRARPGHQVDRLLVTLTPARHSHQDGQSLPQPLLPFTHPLTHTLWTAPRRTRDRHLVMSPYCASSSKLLSLPAGLAPGRYSSWLGFLHKEGIRKGCKCKCFIWKASPGNASGEWGSQAAGSEGYKE